MSHVLTGRVSGFDGRYYQIETDCEPSRSHLKTLNLVKGQMLEAGVGDMVSLAYQTTSHSGLWNVVAYQRGQAVEGGTK
jgi:hypothetical protein